MIILNCVVYWLHDENCTEPKSDGYIGITKNPRARYRTHCRNQRFPLDSKFTILFEGSREECLRLEHELRPYAHIGWNTLAGGRYDRGIGYKHSDQTLEKMRLAHSRTAPHIKAKRYSILKERLTGVKRPPEYFEKTLATKLANNKLDKTQILSIRHDQRSSYKLAEIYGVSPSTIKNIKNRVTWGSLDG